MAAPDSRRRNVVQKASAALSFVNQSLTAMPRGTANSDIQGRFCEFARREQFGIRFAIWGGLETS
jgi:hypothetical protein